MTTWDQKGRRSATSGPPFRDRSQFPQKWGPRSIGFERGAAHNELMASRNVGTVVKGLYEKASGIAVVVKGEPENAPQGGGKTAHSIKEP